MRLCVRCIDNLKIPKVSLKIIEYFLIYGELCVFCLFIKLGQPRRLRIIITRDILFCWETNILLLFCSSFLFFRVLNNFYTFTKVAWSLKMSYFFENIYMVTLWWLTTLRYVGRICAVLGWYFKGYVSYIYYYVDLCTTLTNTSQHNTV